jgi:hypothetical protein
MVHPGACGGCVRLVRPTGSLLLSLYEGGAHIALGYNSWAEYCQQEFHMSDGRAYQLLQAARVIHQLTIVSSPQVVSQVPQSEAIARELAPLLRNPQALNEAWNEAVEAAGGVPTALSAAAGSC